jgi:hypothetical protein
MAPWAGSGGLSLPWDARETRPRLAIRRLKARRVALLQHDLHAHDDWLSLQVSSPPWPVPSSTPVDPVFALLPEPSLAASQPSARVMLKRLRPVRCHGSRAPAGIDAFHRACSRCHALPWHSMSPQSPLVPPALRCCDAGWDSRAAGSGVAIDTQSVTGLALAARPFPANYRRHKLSIRLLCACHLHGENSAP